MATLYHDVNQPYFDGENSLFTERRYHLVNVNIIMLY